MGLKLAFLGSINDEILNKDELAAELCAFLLKAYPGLLAERYGIPEDRSPHELLEQIAIARSCLLKGGGYDVPRAARLCWRFRSGKLGRITLEFPENPDYRKIRTIRRPAAEESLSAAGSAKEGTYGKNTDRRTAGEGAFTAGGHEGIRKGE